MTLENILNAPPPVFGAIALLFAAFLSGLTVVMSALVNARSARQIAKESFRRQLLVTNLGPFTRNLDD